MPTQVLFIQGAGKDVRAKWDSKLVASLAHHLGGKYVVVFPKMPDEANPHFVQWKAAMRQEFERLGDSDFLVGHSVGGTMLLHTIADESPPFKPAALILLAPPFIGPEGWPSDEIASQNDFSRTLPADMPVRLYHGTDDAVVPHVHAELYAKAMPQAVVTKVPHGDHQFGNDLSQVARDIHAIALR